MADVDGDGLPDVIAPSRTVNAIVLLGDGTGQLTPLTANLVATSGEEMKWFSVGDVNGDGAVDIVTGGGRFSSSGTEFAVTLHTTPLRISAPMCRQTPEATAPRC